MTRYIQTTYCDDIRQEINGKVTFVGIYQARLILEKFPATLPKLCIAVKIISPVDDPIQTLKIRVTLDDELLTELVMPDETLQEVGRKLETHDPLGTDDRVQLFSGTAIFSPIHFEGPCIIRVRADTESGELRGLGLAVEQGELANQ